MIGDLRAIARALRGDAIGGQVLAPGPGHGPRDRSLSVTLSAASPDGFVCHSFAGDDWRACRDHVRNRLRLPRDGWKREQLRTPSPKPPNKADAERLERDLASARRIVSEIGPMIGMPGEVYLRNIRRIDVGAIADVLARTDAIGWHPAVYFNEPGHLLHAKRLGCIVGVMTDVKTAEPTGAISRAYLAPDLTKIGKAKTLGAPAGIVRLSPDDEVLGGLHLAEGLETALAAMAIGLRPTWATGSTALLRSFATLGGVEALTVIVDNDTSGAGERAAREVEARWLAADREVNLLRSDAPGDLNDALKGIVR